MWSPNPQILSEPVAQQRGISPCLKIIITVHGGQTFEDLGRSGSTMKSQVGMKRVQLTAQNNPYFENLQAPESTKAISNLRDSHWDVPRDGQTLSCIPSLASNHTPWLDIDLLTHHWRTGIYHGVPTSWGSWPENTLFQMGVRGQHVRNLR